MIDFYEVFTTPRKFKKSAISYIEGIYAIDIQLLSIHNEYYFAPIYIGHTLDKNLIDQADLTKHPKYRQWVKHAELAKSELYTSYYPLSGKTKAQLQRIIRQLDIYLEPF